jgi:hypothetical protein
MIARIVDLPEQIFVAEAVAVPPRGEKPAGLPAPDAPPATARAVEWPRDEPGGFGRDCGVSWPSRPTWRSHRWQYRLNAARPHSEIRLEMRFADVFLMDR